MNSGGISPRHRPVNHVRLNSMVRWYQVALADARLRAPGDIQHFLAARPTADVSLEQQMAMVLSALRSSNELALSDDGDWLEVHFDRHELDPCDQQGLSRLVEQQQASWAPSPKLRGDRMAVYRVAAASFNTALAQAQSHGLRCAEQPTTPGALERAINRYRRTSVE